MQTDKAQEKVADHYIGFRYRYTIMIHSSDGLVNQFCGILDVEERNRLFHRSC